MFALTLLFILQHKLIALNLELKKSLTQFWFFLIDLFTKNSTIKHFKILFFNTKQKKIKNLKN
jgi:hypothetical protein